MWIWIHGFHAKSFSITKTSKTEPYVSSGTENCNNAWWPLEAATFKSGNTNVNVNKVLTQG